MILFIIILLIIAVIVMFVILSDNTMPDIGDWISAAAVALVFSFVVGGVVGGAITIQIYDVIVPTKVEHGWTNTIVSMKDNNAYVVSRRNVEQSDRYYYMVAYDGYYKSHWVNQSRSRIYEVDNGPYVIKTNVEVRQPRNFIERDMVTALNWFFDSANLDHSWDFYVPKGSVVQDFVLDME